MSSIWTRSIKATPQYDCGLCGYTRCASFARAFVVGDVSINACPILSFDEFGGLQSELESVAMRSTTLQPQLAQELPSDGLLLTMPCKDSTEKVMAELRVTNGVEPGTPIRFGVFDPILFCELLDCLRQHFETLKCSRDLGYGRADTGDMSITLLQDGRINMRRVSDKEEVLKIFSTIEQAILGSIICNCCGNDFLSIIIDDIPPKEDTHPVFNAGSRIHLTKDILNSSFSKKELLTQFGDEIDKTITLIENLGEALVNSITGLKKGNIEEYPEDLISDTRCSIMSVFIQTDDMRTSSFITKTLALLWALESGFDSISESKVILDSLDEASMSGARSLIDSVLSGIIEDPEPNNKLLFQLYAALLRASRGIRLYNIWNDY